MSITQSELTNYSPLHNNYLGGVRHGEGTKTVQTTFQETPIRGSDQSTAFKE
jgi:hypothetical protein